MSDAYFTDAEGATEMTRLLLQDRQLTEDMGGPFSERANDFTGITSILDIACGPGGWALAVADAHRDCLVTGIDISRVTTAYAMAQADVLELDNVDFEVMDVTKPLDFLDQSFDLVNARFLASFLSREGWPKLLQECFRILRPGGLLRVTEMEIPMSNGDAYEQLNELVAHAFYAAGKSYSPRNLGITTVLASLLQQTGYHHIQRVPHALDYSMGSKGYNVFSQDATIGFRLVLPFIHQWCSVPLEELERLYTGMQSDLLRPSFCATWYLLTVGAEKPRLT